MYTCSRCLKQFNKIRNLKFHFNTCSKCKLCFKNVSNSVCSVCFKNVCNECQDDNIKICIYCNLWICTRDRSNVLLKICNSLNKVYKPKFHNSLEFLCLSALDKKVFINMIQHLSLCDKGCTFDNTKCNHKTLLIKHNRKTYRCKRLNILYVRLLKKPYELCVYIDKKLLGSDLKSKLLKQLFK